MAEVNIGQKIWDMATVLMNDGVSNSDYLEQITYILFLKMVSDNQERAKRHPEMKWNISIPEGCSWNELYDTNESAIIPKYEKALATLSIQDGTMRASIFNGAKNKISTPARLKKLLSMVNDFKLSTKNLDSLGEIYESLMERIASDTKTGAGQYFTPRALIHAIVDCMKPEISVDANGNCTKIADPCCGSGGFLLRAKKYFDDLALYEINNPDCRKYYSTNNIADALKSSVFMGNEIVSSTRRTCLMNMVLHGISKFDAKHIPIELGDSLINQPNVLVDYVLTNPPFGTKSEKQEVEKKDKDGNIKMVTQVVSTYNRDDFAVKNTTNKQLNFLQHIMSMLKIGGKAAVVLPDNVLFDGDAGSIIRAQLMKKCDLHTILRLPKGIFYAMVSANVLFFDMCEPSETIHTKEVWVYDYRTNIKHTLKTKPLKRSNLDDFVKCFNPDNRHERTETERFHKFTYDEIAKDPELKLDLKWLKEDNPLESDKSVAELLVDMTGRSKDNVSLMNDLNDLLKGL